MLYCFFQVTHPFELLDMDLTGKVNQSICVMVDDLTKWPQAYNLCTKTAAEVTECIITFFHQLEALKRILTDQGTEFVNVVILKILEKNVAEIFVVF